MCKNTHLSIWIQIDPHCGTNLTCKKDVHRHTPVGNVILWILRSKKNHLHCTFFLKNFSTLCLCWSSSCFYCLLIWIHSVVFVLLSFSSSSIAASVVVAVLAKAPFLVFFEKIVWQLEAAQWHTLANPWLKKWIESSVIFHRCFMYLL